MRGNNRDQRKTGGRMALLAGVILAAASFLAWTPSQAKDSRDGFAYEARPAEHGHNYSSQQSVYDTEHHANKKYKNKKHKKHKYKKTQT